MDCAKVNHSLIAHSGREREREETGWYRNCPEIYLRNAKTWTSLGREGMFFVLLQCVVTPVFFKKKERLGASYFKMIVEVKGLLWLHWLIRFPWELGWCRKHAHTHGGPKSLLCFFTFIPLIINLLSLFICMAMKSLNNNIMMFRLGINNGRCHWASF